MTKFMPFLYDNNLFFTNQKCFFINTLFPAYLTAFFNSSLFKFCFRDNFPELQGGTRELSKIFFDKIPVLEITEQIEYEFNKLVIDIQDSYSIEKAQMIDNKIFDLYGLSKEEKSIIGYIEIQ